MNNKREKIIGIIKYILGLLGFIGIVLAVLTATNLLDTLMLKFNFKVLNSNQKLITSLISSVVGILFLFIAFSKQIDKFFQILGTSELKLNKKRKGISAEAFFFTVISIILIVLALMLALDVLNLQANLPILGKYTELFLIISLVILALFAIFTAFNEIIIQSIKEMRKVSWPTGKQMLDYSIKVFSFIIFFSILFVAIDYPTDKLISFILDLK